MSDTYDLLILTDGTSSMGDYLTALKTSIPEILGLAQLSGAFRRLGVLAYRDYSEPEDECIVWSGWNPDDLLSFVRRLEPEGGGDFPEAAKTALIRGLQAVDKSTRTLILWYTDAPPHHPSVNSHQNDVKEAAVFPAGATDWVKLCRMAAHRNCTVFSFTPQSLQSQFSCFYTLLSELTGGISISTSILSSALISRLTLDIILQWMGQAPAIAESLTNSGASLNHYKSSPINAIPKPSNELAGSHGYLPPPQKSGAYSLLPIATVPLKSSSIPTGHFPSASRTESFAKRFAIPSEEAYRKCVYTSLSTIIDSNVACLTYNPIFGQLWRAVCKDKTNIAEKVKLINSFSAAVGKIADPEAKKNLALWLEESFDATEEIEAIIAGAPTGGPLVYLDLDSGVDLTRSELLEVSRSCYSGVLKKLASILTHLKLVDPTSDMTLTQGHLTIPLSLSPVQFFRILPHLVVPGTMYGKRAASLMAILALTTAVPFLHVSATSIVAPLKGNWLNLDVPENISWDCANLLLSVHDGVTLTAQEKRVYTAMKRYKNIEMNLQADVNVRVGWTPKKRRNVGDRQVICKKCHIRRSVTIMSDKDVGVCGLCVWACSAKKDPVAYTAMMNYTNENEAESCWVECSTKTCHAHYVVVDVALLRIRPRCYYCRTSTPCPSLSCTRCLNCVIIPHPYRTASDTPASFVCPACTANEIQTVEEETATTKALVAQNGVTWLGLEPLDGVLEGKSAFKLMSMHGAAAFGSSPVASSSPKAVLALKFNGKKIHNPKDVLAQVEGRVEGGVVDLQGTCSLCYDDVRRDKLIKACGRSGCENWVDAKCLREWYGSSAPGELLSPTQLHCPFCRRLPAIKVLSRFNAPATTLFGLQIALTDTGFFYAWCIECGYAKRAYERACCGGEQVAELHHWSCTACQEAHMRLVRMVDMDLNETLPVKINKNDLQIVKLGFKHCPGCEAPIEKISGCNHMTCICGQHFCYVCGVGMNADSIYYHISRMHGGQLFGDD